LKRQQPGRYTQVILDHTELVGTYLARMVHGLTLRAVRHDRSKFGPDEYPAYEAALPRFEAADYGTPEYIAVCKSIGPAISHHVTSNRHHPEFFGEAGVAGMNLLDLTEMVCDWVAAAQRGGGTLADLRLDIQAERFKIDPQLASIIANTVAYLAGEEV
jgi:hypothetical protein